MGAPRSARAQSSVPATMRPRRLARPVSRSVRASSSSRALSSSMVRSVAARAVCVAEHAEGQDGAVGVGEQAALHRQVDTRPSPRLNRFSPAPTPVRARSASQASSSGSWGPRPGRTGHAGGSPPRSWPASGRPPGWPRAPGRRASRRSCPRGRVRDRGAVRRQSERPHRAQRSPCPCDLCASTLVPDGTALALLPRR